MSIKKVLILGCGTIGISVAKLLQATKYSYAPHFDVCLADVSRLRLQSAANETAITSVLVCKEPESWVDTLGPDLVFDYVINCLPHMVNAEAAIFAACRGCHYFDLTEDLETTIAIRSTVPFQPTTLVAQQLGLAPGFINILGYHLAKQFDRLDSLKLRTGSLPRYPTNPPLNYNRLWSLEGLVNQYTKSCAVVRGGISVELPALTDKEAMILEGRNYEAFLTSGGLAGMSEHLQVTDMDYKTLRYPGHCAFIRNLREVFRMTNAEMITMLQRVPKTAQDMVVVTAQADGMRNENYESVVWSRTIYSTETMSAIQLTTASGICAVIDLHANGQIKQNGFLDHADVPLGAFLANRFGSVFGPAESHDE